jgi:TolB-like protein
MALPPPRWPRRDASITSIAVLPLENASGDPSWNTC